MDGDGVPIRRPCFATTRACRALWTAGVSPLVWALGDGQEVATTCCDSGIPVSCGRDGRLPRLPSVAVGETHVATIASVGLPRAKRLLLGPVVQLWLSATNQIGLLQKVVRTCARGLDRRCPHGVAQGFQITSHKWLQSISRTRNLFSKDCCRFSDFDKSVPKSARGAARRRSLLPTGGGEWLAGQAGPNRSVVRPSSESPRWRAPSPMPAKKWH